jgi:hypothetical protein
MRAIGQTFSRLGSSDVRKDVHGDIDFRIGRQISSCKKEDSPPKRVKPIPIIIIIFILAQAFGQERDEGAVAIADMITITFFYLFCPGEYAGTTLDVASFRIEDFALYIQDRCLDSMKATSAKIAAADAVTYTFTTHKNGRRNETLVYGRSGDSLCFPVRATARCILYHRASRPPPPGDILSNWTPCPHQGQRRHRCPSPGHDDGLSSHRHCRGRSERAVSPCGGRHGLTEWTGGHGPHQNDGSLA